MNAGSSGKIDQSGKLGPRSQRGRRKAGEPERSVFRGRKSQQGQMLLSETRPAKCLQDLAATRVLMTLSRMVSVERCGQEPDSNGLPGEVTFESGNEWQVRN